jgi:hypothetical protein
MKFHGIARLANRVERRPPNSSFGGTNVDDRSHCRSQTRLVPRRTALLTLAAITLLGFKRSRAEAGFTKIAKAISVWRDRILNPDELALFCGRYQIGALFLYLTPQAGEPSYRGKTARERWSPRCALALDACMPASANWIG